MMPRYKKIPEDWPFHEGERVQVYNTTMGGKLIVEGTATIKGRGDVEDQYVVRFDGETADYMRFVYPD